MGKVERVTKRGISGWIEPVAGAEPLIAIKVNGRQVANTLAIAPPDPSSERLTFSRRLEGLWPYLGSGDEVSFEYADERLPVGKAAAPSHAPTGDRSEDLADLFAKLDSGWMLDKKGTPAPPLGESRKVALFRSLYGDLERAVRERFGLRLHANYGTLLGAIREGDFIAHDNDVDVSYMSAHSDPESVKREYIELVGYLIDEGYSGVLKRHGFGIKSPLYIDIFQSWVGPDGKYDIGFGYHFDQVEWSPEDAELIERPIGPMMVLTPRGGEKLLEQFYGSGWRVPDPGFTHYKASRRQTVAYLPTEEEMKPLHWKQFYRQNEIAEPSTFAAFMRERLEPGTTVIDIGCGTGRDTTYFAAEGFHAIGADASAEGVARGAERNVPDCRFTVLDVCNSDQLDALFQSADIRAALDADRELLVYARFFLHAINAEAQENLLDAIARNLPKVTLAAEFRTEKDEAIEKVALPHYRRFQTMESFVSQLRDRYGFNILHAQEDRGLSVYKGEDPYLARVIARRG